MSFAFHKADWCVDRDLSQVLGRIKKTQVIRKVTTCIFEETLYFNLNKLSISQIEEVTKRPRVLFTTDGSGRLWTRISRRDATRDAFSRSRFFGKESLSE